ncbi:hypothetical protein GCM10009682_38420 [Luedemannella flava]|uniref:Peptidase M48 domain-containing protein n=1 Tax=Luedemannella flava TaxID=349316 RepID=A0ABP4YIJ8_9ACTN
MRQAEPWCPACEWRLDHYEPGRRPGEFGWASVDRWAFRLAYRLTARQFAALAGRAVGRSRATRTRVVLSVVGVGFLAAVVAMLALGLYLVAVDFPSPMIVPGVVLILLAIELRPRLGRLSAADRRLTRTQTPTLFGLIDEVAGAVGGPVPDVVVVSEQVNASAGVVGPGKRVLVLGLPLWAVLPAQHRVALLGHELAHFVNGDVRRLPLVRVATTTLGGLAGLLRFPELDGTVGPVAWLVRGLAWAARSTVLAVHLVLVWIGLRDAQRAEYRADEVAAEVAGSAATVATINDLLAAESIDMLVRRDAPQGGGPDRWRESVAQVRADRADLTTAYRQLSVRDETSLFASHPPTGLRIRMIESRPWETGKVGLTETRSAAIDEELRTLYESVRRDLLG